MDNLKYNGSGYRDVVAEKAIRSADQQPPEISVLVDIFKKTAELSGYEISGRIAFKSKKTGAVYK